MACKLCILNTALYHITVDLLDSIGACAFVDMIFHHLHIRVTPFTILTLVPLTAVVAIEVCSEFFSSSKRLITIICVACEAFSLMNFAQMFLIFRQTHSSLIVQQRQT